jgi:cytochrome P450
METWASHGDIVRLTLPGQVMYMVTGPSLIEEILVTKHDSFSIDPAQREAFSGVEDHAATTTTGDRWKRLRNALYPAFTRDNIERYGDRVSSARPH